jgi:lambda family phage minor tail protein L
MTEYVQSDYWVTGYAVGNGYTSLTAELQLVAPSAVIELFELELNATQHGVNETYRFHAGTNLNSNGQLVWAGNAYLRFPIEADSFEYSGNGQLPRPKIRCSNIMGTITALLLSLPDGLEGAKVSRIRTLARYIDGANFPGGTNPYGTPDPTAEFPREVFYVDRKVAETRDVVEFELAASFDLAGVRAPKRQCIANICQWVYRSAECGYGGPPVATKNGEIIRPNVSPQATAYYAADTTVQTTRTALNTATQNLNTAANDVNIAQQYSKLDDRYDSSNYASATQNNGVWNGAYVTLGSTYRRGAAVTSGRVTLARIQRWGFNAATLSAAQAAYTAALSAYNTATTNFNNALAARAAAFATWQAANFAADVAASNDACGKQLTDCELRYNLEAITATDELPFGSFPGVGTFNS